MISIQTALGTQADIDICNGHDNIPCESNTMSDLKVKAGGASDMSGLAGETLMERGQASFQFCFQSIGKWRLGDHLQSFFLDLWSWALDN